MFSFSYPSNMQQFSILNTPKLFIKLFK